MIRALALCTVICVAGYRANTLCVQARISSCFQTEAQNMAATKTTQKIPKSLFLVIGMGIGPRPA
jgi:hypothetical protein